jgi:superfamily II DNA/RNA helicase
MPTVHAAPVSAFPSFISLGLSPALTGAAAALGWRVPTPVQTAALPAILQGQDVLAAAPTGSGKTAAFVLPLLQRLLAGADDLARRPRPLRVLILAPTRELALQTGEVLQRLTQHAAPTLKTVVAVGGLSINPQMMALRGGAQVVVATPGRLLDLLDHNALRLSDLATLVLDEADRLLDGGFADEVGRLLAALPARRQTLLFSATLPAAVHGLADQLLRAPLQVALAPHSNLQRDAQATLRDATDAIDANDVADAVTAASAAVASGATSAAGAVTADAADPAAALAAAVPAISQRAIEVDGHRRTPLLRQLIASQGWDRVLVFVATQYASEHVADKLKRAGIPAAALHGQLSQGRRTQVLADFQASRLTVLVATDLAARGLDIAGLAAVVNHDLARSAVDHIHRIGRTGRAGAAGQAISFIAADARGAEAHFRLIEKRQGQRVPREQVPGFEPALAATADTVSAMAGDAAPAAATAGVASDPNGGVKGRRKSKKDKLREAAAAAGRRSPRPRG